jgi:hypothetical protein
MAQIQPPYIYESPDGGKTIYRRTMGNAHREKHFESADVIASHERNRQDQLWRQIRLAASQNTQLSKMLDEVIIYYRLISES